MHWFKVNSNSRFSKFLEVGNAINAKADNYLPYPAFVLRSLLLKNKDYKVESWYCLDDQSNPLGRISAFVSNETGDAGLGFFESINDRNTANAIIQKGINWLQEMGVKKVRMPISPSERDQFWGLMVEHELRPTFGESFHQTYYQDLVQDYGFELEFEQFTPRIGLSDQPLKKYDGLLERLRQKRTWTFRSFNFKEREDFIEDLVCVYNEAWADMGLARPLQISEVRAMFRSMKPILDPRLTVFAYLDERPVGFFIALPDMNEIMSRLGPKMNLWNYMKLLWYKRKSVISTAKGLVFGLIPEVQRTGMGLAMADVFERNLQGSRYKYIELSWIGGFNPNMLSFVEKIGAKPYKKHHTYIMDINIEKDNIPIR